MTQLRPGLTQDAVARRGILELGVREAENQDMLCDQPRPFARHSAKELQKCPHNISSMWILPESLFLERMVRRGRPVSSDGVTKSRSLTSRTNTWKSRSRFLLNWKTVASSQRGSRLS